MTWLYAMRKPIYEKQKNEQISKTSPVKTPERQEKLKNRMNNTITLLAKRYKANFAPTNR